MPPRESISRAPRTDVYSVLLVVAAAFLALAVLITFGELKSDYDFMGSDTGGVAAPAAEETPAPEKTTEPSATTTEPAATTTEPAATTTEAAPATTE